MTLSSSVLPRPPPLTVPIVATSTDLGMCHARRWPAKGAVVAPAAGAATRTILPATAMPSMTMTYATTPSFGAPIRALCNVDGVPVGGGGASGIGGTNCAARLVGQEDEVWHDCPSGSIIGDGGINSRIGRPGTQPNQNADRTAYSPMMMV
jgi:hypothetical protein